MKNLNAIARNMARIMRRLGMTPEDVTEETGMGLRRVNRIMAGLEEPDDLEIQELAMILRCSEEDLWLAQDWTPRESARMRVPCGMVIEIEIIGEHTYDIRIDRSCYRVTNCRDLAMAKEKAVSFALIELDKRMERIAEQRSFLLDMIG